MKKLLISSIVLCLFAVSILLFDISCTKTAGAQITTTTTTGLQQLGIVLYTKNITNTNTTAGMEFWIANYDGSNAHQIPVTAPTGYSLDGGVLSPDGKKLFYNVYQNNSSTNERMYSCNVDGSNVTPFISNISGYIKGAY